MNNFPSNYSPYMSEMNRILAESIAASPSGLPSDNGMYYSEDEIRTNYPDHLNNLLDRTGKAIEGLPVLDLSGRHGSTGYIDFLKPEDLSDPVMRFTDDSTRSGLAFRVRIKEGSERKADEGVIVIFKRYSTVTSNWLPASSSRIISIPYGRGDRAVQHNPRFPGCPESLQDMRVLLPGLLEGTDPDLELY